MNVIVTGGAGFIGTSLCKRLLFEGCTVYCVDNLQTSCKSNIEQYFEHDKFKFIEADVCDEFEFVHEFIYGEFGPIHQIYHLACPASPEHYQRDPIRTLNTCYIGTQNVLKLAMHFKCTVLFASTSEIYGDPDVHPQTEQYHGNVDPISIRSCYDEGKRVAETLVTEYHRKHNIDVRIARIFNTYGPYLTRGDGRVISNFICQALQNKPISVYGDGSQTRSFCYVDDTVDGLYKLMNTANEILSTSPVNIGNPDERTILDCAQTIIKLTKSKSQISFNRLPDSDPKRRCPDITLAQTLICWSPEVLFEHGLLKTIAYFEYN